MRRRWEYLMRRFWEPLELETGTFPVDISETEEELVVRANLPGFDKTEVNVSVTENSVDIAAQHKEKKVRKDERFYMAERKVGTLRRFVTLPVPVDYRKARAEMKNGVLTIRLPKKVRKKESKKLKIE